MNPLQVNARQRIHTKNQALLSSKDKSKKLKCRLLQFLFGTLTVIPDFMSVTRHFMDNYQYINGNTAEKPVSMASNMQYRTEMVIL